MVAPTDNRMPLRNCHHIADNLLRQKTVALEHLLRKSLLLKLENLDKKDREIRRKPELKNNLESYVYATKEKVQDWLYMDGEDGNQFGGGSPPFQEEDCQ
uniref:Uncharacterized protein n=1 Tax=Brassica oleracea var. oleracea TaxID=109376 RepID=A0A0D3A9F8_BRAOL